MIMPYHQVSHPDYDGRAYDFRLVFLPEASQYTPVQLNPNSGVPAVNAPQTVIGMGTTKWQGSSSDRLLKVTVNKISNNACRGMYHSLFNEDNMVCAMVAGGGKDSCQGDR